MSWKSVTNAEGYQAYCYDSDGNQVKTKKLTTNTWTVENLDIGSTYTCKVRAYWTEEDGTVTYGSKSDAYKVYTTPGQVQRLTATSQKKTSITLSWKKLAGVKGYQLYQYDETAGKYVRVKEGLTQASYTVSGLTAGKSYKFKVRGYNRLNSSTNNYGKYSSVLTVYTVPEQIKM